MYQPFHSALKSAVGWKDTKANKDGNISRQPFWPPYFGMRLVFCSPFTSRKEEPLIANIIKYYQYVWKKKLPKNCHKWRRKIALSSSNALCNKSMARMAKVYEFYFELLSGPPFFPDLAPSNFWLFIDLKWRSDIRNREVYWKRREIVLQKKAPNC